MKDQTTCAVRASKRQGVVGAFVNNNLLVYHVALRNCTDIVINHGTSLTTIVTHYVAKHLKIKRGKGMTCGLMKDIVLTP